MTDTLKGKCFCGEVTFEATGKPRFSAYCHCTRCQRRAASPFVHTLHYAGSQCRWTTERPIDEICYNFDTGYKCKKCGTGIAWIDPTGSLWCIWGAQFERDEEGKIKNWDVIKPTAHVFYDTRMLDVGDGLGKWKGLEGKSEKIM